MKNWAGSLEFNPKQILGPKNEQEISRIIKEACAKKQYIRTRGATHSWTKLIQSDEIYLHLDEMQGIISQNNNLIKAWAGTRLHLLGEEAFKLGFAMANQGDVNPQSIAGATSTGTHGTGISLQSVSNQINAMNVINGLGEKISITNENLELYHASRVAMGALGIVSSIELNLIPAYKLLTKTFAEDMATCLTHYKERLYAHRHLEMFYFPVGDWSLVKTMDITHGEVKNRGLSNKLNEVVVENWLYELLNITASKTKAYQLLDRLMRKFVSPHEFIDWSHRAFPTHRSVKFMEMEFNLPLEHFEAALAEIKFCIKKNNHFTLFPIEIRFVKGDDIWLSPAYQRDSVYFAIHTYITEPFREYFEDMQKIFMKFQGRPHWGKWHSLTPEYLASVYPKWDEFKKLRADFDPNGVFLNPYLKTIFQVS